MQHHYIKRNLQNEVADCLRSFPAVAVLGPRRSGKSTLAQAVLASAKDNLYLDLELPSDARKLSEPELFLNLHRDKLVCFDEIQRMPDLFPVLRCIIDQRRRPGQFLILGSASRDLIRQSSETLAGRIAYLELTPFLYSEAAAAEKSLNDYWLRGGFPESALAATDFDSVRWRRNFIRTFLERDIPQLGIQIPARSIERLWLMCAHYHGQTLNLSRIGESLGVTHTTVRSHVDILAAAFMARILPPLLPNLRKRLVKSPRVYLRDAGILHALLDIETMDDLMGHPVFGASWEGLVIENILATYSDWQGHFYRSATGAELDLVLDKGRRRIVVECKASPAPQVTQGFWNALKDLEAREAWIIAPVDRLFPLAKGVTVASLAQFLARRPE